MMKKKFKRVGNAKEPGARKLFGGGFLKAAGKIGDLVIEVSKYRSHKAVKQMGSGTMRYVFQYPNNMRTIALFIVGAGRTLFPPGHPAGLSSPFMS